MVQVFQNRSHGVKPRFKPAIILHGGAGNIERSRLPPELYEQYRASLLAYLRSTYSLLNAGQDHDEGILEQAGSGRKEDEENIGSSALDAAVHAVSLMEDDPLFNAGRGSVFTTAGTIEMEASVMVSSVFPPIDPSSTPEDAIDRSKDEINTARIKRGAGVMMVRNVRHPIRLAREVLLRTGYKETDGDGGNMHSQLCGPHVEKLARDWGLEFKPDEWFWTKRRWDEHRRGLQGPKVNATIDHDAEEDLTTRFKNDDAQDDSKYLSQGTVGAVCLDKWGNIAVATSTGGLTNKLPGRIGDTPTLGAGFWAEDWDIRGHGRGRRRAVAVSGTGNGDSFLRTAAARTASAMARFSQGNVSLSEAVTAVSGPGGELERSAGDRWGKTGEGTGGMIGIEVQWDRDGQTQPQKDGQDSDGQIRGKVSFDFNGGGMFRAWIEEDSNGVDHEKMMVFREEYK